MILRSELKKSAKNQLKYNWATAIGITIVSTLISWIPNILVTINNESFIMSIIIQIITLAITGPLTIGQCKFFINIANESNPTFSDLWYGFNNTLKGMVMALLVAIIVFIGTIFLIIPGIILTFMYSQVYYIMAENPDISIIDCLKESSRIMKGHKMDLFVLQLSFIGWMILTGITSGIAGLYVLPYYNATLNNFYLQIKD